MRNPAPQVRIASAILCLLLETILTNAASGPSTAVPVREADAVCDSCHHEIFQKYLNTPMANASGLAADRAFTGSFHHAASGVDYKISKEKGDLWLSYSLANEPAVQGRHKLDYFLGSGHLGITYLYSFEGFFFESPVAYYAKTQALDMKPGLNNFPYLPASLPMTSGCMRCHMSDVQREDADTHNHFSGLPFLHAGITCESCHGDTTRHVASGGKAPVINPIKLDAERRDSVCISCHLEGDTRIEHAGRSALEYKPGDRINDYLSYFVYASDKITSRGVSEIEELAQSRCKQTSGDGMSCMSCHDAHYSPPPDTRAAFYRQKCLACHTRPGFATSHYAPTPDCTQCHMPKAQADRVPHIAWTDHRLRREYIPAKLAFDSSSGPSLPDLVPFAQEKADPRDLGLAYYDLVVAGNFGEAPRAWTLLSAARDAHPEDLPLLVALGYLAQLNRNSAAAIAIYRDVLKLDPLNPAATNNLAILLARSGQLPEAQTLWRKTFALNQDSDEPGINLAAAECMSGDKDAALLTLKQVLTYNPGRQLARQRLAAIQSDQEACTARPAN